MHRTVERLLRHALALREIADGGRYLVFPSQFNCDYEDAPEPKLKALAITIDEAVQSLYSTLAVWRVTEGFCDRSSSIASALPPIRGRIHTASG